MNRHAAAVASFAGDGAAAAVPARPKRTEYVRERQRQRDRDRDRERDTERATAPHV